MASSWTFGSRLTPAVVLTPDGQIVVAYSDLILRHLRSQLGQFRPDFRVEWSESQRYDDGVLPTLSLRADGRIREIHKSENNDQNWTWIGEIQNGEVVWRNNERTASNRFDVHRSGRFEVVSGVDAYGLDKTLQIMYDNGPLHPIRYRQPCLRNSKMAMESKLEIRPDFLLTKPMTMLLWPVG